MFRNYNFSYNEFRKGGGQMKFKKGTVGFMALLLSFLLLGCNVKNESKDDVLEVWSFTDEVKGMIPYFEEKYPNIKVEFTLVPTDVYASKLKNAIQSGNAPDVFALEGAFVRSFVEEPGVMENLDDLKTDLKEMEIVPYTLDIGTDFEGNLKAVSWQAAPGAMFYRRSLAKKYLGTDDPAEVQNYFSDMSKFMETAEMIQKNSDGKCFTVCTPDDLSYIFKSERETGWVKDGKIVIDDKMLEFADFYKQMDEKGFSAKQTAWSEGWFAGMSGQLKDVNGNPQEIFSYFFPAWGLSYTLIPNAASADGTMDTSGDWGVINGPAPYYWGGTWLGVNSQSDNKEMAKEMVKYFSTDEEFLTQWVKEKNDYVASKKIMEKVTANVSNDFLAGQNPYEVFLKDSQEINGKLLTSYDQEMDRIYNNEKENYKEGRINLDELKDNLTEKAKRMFPDIE